MKTVAKRTGQRVLLERGENPPGEGRESSWRGKRILLERGGRVLLEREEILLDRGESPPGEGENPPGERAYHSLQLPQDPLSCSLGCQGLWAAASTKAHLKVSSHSQLYLNPNTDP